MENIKDKVKSLLESIEYEFKESDELSLNFALDKAKNYVGNYCNIDDFPNGLIIILVNLVFVEFLCLKKLFEPSALKGLDFSKTLSSISEGDVSLSYKDEASDSQKLDLFIASTRKSIDSSLLRYRRLVW